MNIGDEYYYKVDSAIAKIEKTIDIADRSRLYADFVDCRLAWNEMVESIERIVNLLGGEGSIDDRHEIIENAQTIITELTVHLPNHHKNLVSELEKLLGALKE